MRTTYMPTGKNIEREWYVVDATDIPLGRLSTVVAAILRGKHKPTFTPHVDMGDNVIVINAEKVALTGNKAEGKIYYDHSRVARGIKARTAGSIRENQPEHLVERSIKGMLPHNRLGRQMYRKLHVYAGPDHKHAAQQPKELDIEKYI